MLDVIIITHNEEINLPHCLEPLGNLARKVFIVDSGSTDQTPQIAQQYDAEFVPHDWEGYAQQKNWALDSLPIETEWILLLDADEQLTEILTNEIKFITSRPSEQISENGFFINRLTYFMGDPIRHCGYYPSWNLRLFKTGKGRYEKRRVHEHVVIDNPVGYLKNHMIHHDRRSLEHFYAKHNRYSTLEAIQLFEERANPEQQNGSANLTNQTKRRRWLKQHVTHRIPFPGLWRFIYMYIIRLGILDGKTGLRFCAFIAHYDNMVALKLRNLLRNNASNGNTIKSHQYNQSGLAIQEGSSSKQTDNKLTTQTIESQNETPTLPEGFIDIEMNPESSPWPFLDKVRRACWMLIGKPLFRLSFHNWYGYRRIILRVFGAKIAKGVTIRPSVNIEIPWMLEIHEHATIGDYAILYSLGKITIGRRSIISQYAHLCAGTHDYTNCNFPLLRLPISIEDDVWIGADVFIGPNVTIGQLSVVGARSNVYKDLPPQKVCVGNPAKPIKNRKLTI